MEPFDSLVISTNLTDLNSDTLLGEETRQKFLGFSLGSEDKGLLALEQLAEVLSVAVADILPVPEMPGCVLGIYNWRGTMLWLIDLSHLLDYPPLLQLQRESESLMVIVIQMNGQAMGLVVQHVNDIELHAPANIQPATVDLFPPGLLPFIKGYLPSAHSTVLDPAAIARCPLWQVHRG